MSLNSFSTFINCSGGAESPGGIEVKYATTSNASLMAYSKDALEAVSGTIHRVGTEIGMGQTVKACLQSLIGSIFTGAYEATALAAKADVPGQVLYDVFSTSAVHRIHCNAIVSSRSHPPSRHPDGGNQAVAKISEEFIGTGLHK